MVYLGPDLPDYVKRNLKQIRRNFSKNELYFITDNAKSREIVTQLGILTFFVEKDLQKQLTKVEGLDREFRAGFWIYTAARFAAISEFMHFMGDNESVLQIEADVWLAPNFPMQSISTISKDIAFPITQKSTGLASVLFIRDRSSALFLSNYFDTEFRRGKFVIDYEILGKLQKEHPDKVYVLPSALPGDQNFNSSADPSVRRLITSNNSAFDGIFDGSTWGQYLVGEDPRNFFGIRRVFHFQPHHAVNPVSVKFQTIPNLGVLGELNFEKKFIYNLHIHSKDKRIFDRNGLNFINKRISQVRKKTKYEFKISILLELLRSEGIKSISVSIIRVFKNNLITYFRPISKSIDKFFTK